LGCNIRVLEMKRDVSLSVPEYYIPKVDSGVRDSRAFESLTLSPDNTRLWTGLENALVQDGPVSSLEDESLSRILEFDVATVTYSNEVVYVCDTIPEVPEPSDGYADNGLVELIALDDNGSFLALERSYSSGVGNNIRLYQIFAQGASDTLNVNSLLMDKEGVVPFEIGQSVQKELIVDFEADLGVVPDNMEAMALIRNDDEGTARLVVVSDNNYSKYQKSLFVLIELSLQKLGTKNHKSKKSPSKKP